MSGGLTPLFGESVAGAGPLAQVIVEEGLFGICGTWPDCCSGLRADTSSRVHNSQPTEVFMSFAAFARSAAAVACVGLFVGAAQAATVVALGTLTGTGTVVVANNAQNTPLSWNFNTAFSFDTTPRAELGGFSIAQVMGDVGQFRFQANSAGVMAVDGNGIGGAPIQRGLQQWQILNTVPNNNNSTFYGNPFLFNFIEDAPLAPSGTMNGTLTSDGFIHWYYGYDEDTCFDPPGPATCVNGRTPLLNPVFDFVGRYSITGFSFDGQGNRTLSVSLTGTISQQVPVPATLALVGVALLAAGAAGRRKAVAA